MLLGFVEATCRVFRFGVSVNMGLGFVQCQESPEFKEVLVCVFSSSGIACEVLIIDQVLAMLGCDGDVVMLGLGEAPQSSGSQPGVFEIAGSS